MKKLLLFKIAILGLIFSNAQIVNIPDANFKNYLVSNTNINTNSDSEIQVSEANAFSGIIYMVGLGVTDITGIEEFISLTEFNSQFNSIAGNVDFTMNTALNKLIIYSALIDTIYLGSKPNLEEVNLSINTLKQIDFMGSGELRDIRVYSGNLNAIDVSQCPLLDRLVCPNNLITSLNLRENIVLRALDLTGLDIQELDLRQNPGLEYLDAEDCSMLTTLSLKSGGNTNIINFDTQNCTSLYCIEVDDSIYSTNNWTAAVDSHHYFKENCNYCMDEYAILEETACDTYTSPSGNYTFTSSSLFFDTILTQCGRDSVLDIEIIINNTELLSVITNSCNTYNSPAGNIYTSTGTYYDTITTTAGCDSIIETNLTIFNTDTTNLMDTFMAGTIYSLPDGNMTSTEGIYSFIFTDVNSCDSVVILDLLAIQGVGVENIAFTDIMVYPNPTKNRIVIDFGNENDKDYVLKISNLLGQSFLEKTITEIKTNIDLSNQPKGTYLLTLSNAEEKYIAKIVLIK